MLQTKLENKIKKAAQLVTSLVTKAKKIYDFRIKQG